ncbi:fumarylacetoacetate hydrolase family protein [Nesterenkonia alba]|uniref:fumarylacetoacetate hydrolase family protein n=1 Tax=Nesterenkonia alba TaxID=515814 RepID=UPI0003B58937|nr:fumarylacetoacetate hydrolase family protein [Nesterenkonia alba]
MPHTIDDVLPADPSGLYIARIWDPARDLPVPALIHQRAVWDASGLAPTVSELCDLPEVATALKALTEAEPWLSVEDITLEEQNTASAPVLLAPVDLQVIKACGVTFVGSMLERVIEERAGGDPQASARIRESMQAELGVDLTTITPGSDEAAAVKEALIARGWWSQYLEVGLGPDPEVFTKAPVLSAVGSGSDIGIPRFSSWNNPEPELVLVVSSAGEIVGVTLGNDVNLRDVEGRSALLLGIAKDNNRSAAIGPVLRIFDEEFTVDRARQLDITLTVEGPEGYTLEGLNSVSALSRSFEELVSATFGDHHQYPDGFVLYTGTLFAPTEDRDVPGEGFTHKQGDVVTIKNSHLGALVNRVGLSEELPPWSYGLRSLLDDVSRLRSDV